MAAQILAEIGTAMTRFPTAGHLDDELAPFDDELARLDEIPGHRAASGSPDPRRDRHRHDQVPHGGPPRLLGQVQPHRQGIRRQPKGSAATGRGNRYLARALGEAAIGASRTHTFLGERYRRIVRHRGKKIALVAVGRSMLVIIWHILSGPDVKFVDLVPHHHDNRGTTERAIRRHLNALHALGYTVTVTPAA